MTTLYLFLFSALVNKCFILICSGTAELKQVDMLHAADYGRMDMCALKDEMNKRKSLDKKIETKMQ